MKPLPMLDTLLARAVALGVHGTKIRSVTNLHPEIGIAEIVRLQFQIADRGLMLIIEPEVLIKSPDKAGQRRSCGRKS